MTDPTPDPPDTDLSGLDLIDDDDEILPADESDEAEAEAEAEETEVGLPLDGLDGPPMPIDDVIDPLDIPILPPDPPVFDDPGIPVIEPPDIPVGGAEDDVEFEDVVDIDPEVVAQ